MGLIKKIQGKRNSVEVFSERIGGKNIFFVSKITKKRIATGQARNKTHAVKWAKRVVR